MFRRAPARNAQLDALIDERIDLKVRLVLLQESANSDVLEIDALKRRVAELDVLITEKSRRSYT